MIPRSILIIDDEPTQARALKKTVGQILPDSTVFIGSTPDEVNDLINNKFFNLAILDIRLEGHDGIDGIDLAKRIISSNPFAKILFVSRYAEEYMEKLMPLMAQGNILGFSAKKDYDLWAGELANFILPYYEELDNNPESIQTALLSIYAETKNETDTYRKGVKFEQFVSLLFGQIGYTEIKTRNIDKSRNEVDLIVRNDIKDHFLSRLGEYFLVECKNKPDNIVSKNDFIVFQSKLNNSNGMARIGFIFSTSSFSKNAFLEAMRSSTTDKKVFFVDNAEIMLLLKAPSLREAFKKLIDKQVKDN